MRKRIPGLLWVAIVALWLMIFGKACLIPKKPLILVDVALSAVLLFGIIRGRKWAYVLTILFSLFGTFVAFAKSGRAGIQVFLLNCLVLAPVLLCTRHFFATQEADDRCSGKTADGDSNRD